MNDALQKIRQETLDRLKEVREEKELEALNVSVLGRNGALTEILRTMGKLDKEQRAKLGQASNAVKKELEEAIGARREKIAELMLERRFEKEALELLQQQKGVSLWQDGFLHLFQYINQNRAVCLCALDSLGKESLKRLLEAEVSSIVDRAVRQTAEENGLPAHSLEVEVVICLVTIMMAGAVESWLRGELTQTPEELTRRIDMMFQDYIRGVALRLKAPAAVYA